MFHLLSSYSSEFTDDYVVRLKSERKIYRFLKVALDRYLKLRIFNYRFFRHVYSSTAFSLPLVIASYNYTQIVLNQGGSIEALNTSFPPETAIS
mgnify:CR=1 FL=1